MRYPFESSAHTSWVAHKNEAKSLYERGDYQAALDSYKLALDPTLEAPTQERQILLSNLVACRLKLGGTAQAEAAVANAKQCINLNPSWAKGHVRLASAYIALGGHSNDACNELQTALRLDPGNSLARQMMVRELRRDHAAASAAAPSDVDDPAEYDRTRDPPQNPHYQPNSNTQDTHIRVEDPIDESFSLTDRMKFTLARMVNWYETRSDDAKLMIKVLAVVLFLYVAFGGRFGLENWSSQTNHHRGHYGDGNVYDQYRNARTTQGSTHRNSYDRYDAHATGGGYNDRRGYNSYGGGYTNDYSYGTGYGGGGGGYGSSMGMSDGAIPMMIMLGIAYLCHRNGINPLHAMFMMNMMGGRRHRRFGYGGGMGGFGYGGGGARMRYGGRRGRW